MAILASTILDRAAALYNDSTFNWKAKPILTDWLHDGEVEICKYKPNAYVTRGIFKLVSGISQSLPDGTSSFLNPAGATLPAGNALIKPRRNMGTNGSTPGSIISFIEWDDLASLNPDWPMETPDSDVEHFLFDIRVPRKFDVYPPQPSSGQGWVELDYGAIPPDIARVSSQDLNPAANATINVADIYANDLINYLLHRVYLVDSHDAANAALSASYWNAFISGLTLRQKKEVVDSPNIEAKQK